MKILEKANFFNKQLVYDVYQALVDNPKEYQRVTRKQMFEKLIEAYTPEAIIEICTTEELKELETFDGSLEESIAVVRNPIKRSLAEKFLIDIAGTIEELSDSIKRVFEIIDWDKKREEDKFNATILGYIRTMGSSLFNPLETVASINFETSEQEFKNYVEHNKFFKFYTYKEEESLSFADEKMTRYVYKDYMDINEDIDQNRKDYALGTPTFLSAEQYQSIFFNGYDTSNPVVCRLFDQMKKKKVSSFLIQYFLAYVALYSDPDWMYENMFNIYEIDKELFLEAVDQMPCAALNGMTPKELDEQVSKYEEYMKKKEEIPRQGNAHLSEKEVKKFYRYYFSLLDYTNKKFKVKPAMEINPYRSVDPQKLIDVIETFWENKDTIIDEYLKKNPLKLSPRGMRSIEAFKDGIRDEFVLVQYEKEYAIFMNEEHVFMVKGLHVNIDEVIDPMSLPTIVTTALIPYERYIVYDSVLQTIPIGIGPNTAKTFEKEMEKLPKLYTLKKRELN